MSKSQNPQNSGQSSVGKLGAVVNRPVAVTETRGQTVNQMKPAPTSTTTTQGNGKVG